MNKIFNKSLIKLRELQMNIRKTPDLIGNKVLTKLRRRFSTGKTPNKIYGVYKSLQRERPTSLELTKNRNVKIP